MSHVPREELHALFYSIERHHLGEAPIQGLELDDELQKIVQRAARDESRKRESPNRLLSEDRVRALMEHTGTCTQCEILVYEQAPYAERPRSEDELAQEQQLNEEEEWALTKRFWISAILGFVSFMGTNISLMYWRRLTTGDNATDGPGLRGVDQGLQIHPLHFLALILLLVAAFSLAEAWRTANLIWLDWNRFKEAVPVIGKRWAARSKKRHKG